MSVADERKPSLATLAARVRTAQAALNEALHAIQEEPGVVVEIGATISLSANARGDRPGESNKQVKISLLCSL